jgi:hypothetical protein
MDIQFDPCKNLSNQAKHGIPLECASQFEWNSAVTWVDDRNVYSEIRFVALGYIGLRLYVLVYTVRQSCCRIISLRKANRREVALYAQT